MTVEDSERADTMRVVARASGDTLAAMWNAAGIPTEAEDLRRPETGLVTVRGRVGGSGQPFNLGEATVTRAAVKLASGEVGQSYILGRDVRKARLCALVDAAWQHPQTRARVAASVIEPLRRVLDEQDEQAREQVAATRVDFFTMLRGED